MQKSHQGLEPYHKEESLRTSSSLLLLSLLLLIIKTKIYYFYKIISTTEIQSLIDDAIIHKLDHYELNGKSSHPYNYTNRYCWNPYKCLPFPHFVFYTVVYIFLISI